MPAIRHDDILLRLIRDVNDIRSALRRVVATLPLYDIDNENSPAQITANQNNYIPGNYDVLRLTSNAAYNITGIANGVKGRKLRIFNVGAYPITLVYESGLSIATNRFKFSSGFNATIAPSSNILIYYDGVQSRWVGGDAVANGAVYTEVYNAAAQGVPFAGVGIKLDPGVVVLDNYGFYDNANNRIVILFDGAYLFVVTANWDSTNPTGTRELFLKNGGVAIVGAEDIFREHPEEYNAKVVCLRKFSQNDIIEFWAGQSTVVGNCNLNNLRVSMIKVS
jgi:hypothetical protein